MQNVCCLHAPATSITKTKARAWRKRPPGIVLLPPGIVLLLSPSRSLALSLSHSLSRHPGVAASLGSPRTHHVRHNTSHAYRLMTGFLLLFDLRLVINYLSVHTFAQKQIHVHNIIRQDIYLSHPFLSVVYLSQIFQKSCILDITGTVLHIN